MSLKITKIFQSKLENILESQEYKIRFEKGNFTLVPFFNSKKSGLSI